MRDILSSISIIVGIMSYLLNMVHADANDLLEEELPATGQSAARSRLRKKLRNTLYFKSLPILLGYLTLFYLCLPTTIDIIYNSVFVLWKFDIFNTIFMCLELSLLIFSVVSSILSIRLLKRYISINHG